MFQFKIYIVLSRKQQTGKLRWKYILNRETPDKSKCKGALKEINIKLNSYRTSTEKFLFKIGLGIFASSNGELF